MQRVWKDAPVRPRLRALACVSIGLIVGIPLGLVLAAPTVPFLTSHPATATERYPLWCANPNPQAGWYYSAAYWLGNGTISSFVGGNGNDTPNAGEGQSWVVIDTGSFSNLTLIHSMYCWVGEGHTGGFAFSVDLATHEVVWNGA